MVFPFRKELLCKQKDNLAFIISKPPNCTITHKEGIKPYLPTPSDNSLWKKKLVLFFLSFIQFNYFST